MSNPELAIIAFFWGVALIPFILIPALSQPYVVIVLAGLVGAPVGLGVGIVVAGMWVEIREPYLGAGGYWPTATLIWHELATILISSPAVCMLGIMGIMLSSKWKAIEHDEG